MKSDRECNFESIDIYLYEHVMPILIKEQDRLDKVLDDMAEKASSNKRTKGLKEEDSPERLAIKSRIKALETTKRSIYKFLKETEEAGERSESKHDYPRNKKNYSQEERKKLVMDLQKIIDDQLDQFNKRRILGVGFTKGFVNALKIAVRGLLNLGMLATFGAASYLKVKATSTKDEAGTSFFLLQGKTHKAGKKAHDLLKEIAKPHFAQESKKK